MNIRVCVLIIAALILGLAGCEEEKKTDKETYREILTSRTLGLAYLEENKLNEAEAEFLKLTRLAPDESMGFANLGLVYLRMGRHEDAIEQLKTAIEKDPENPDVRLILAKVYEVSGDLENSLKELQNIIEYAPDHIKTLYSLAEFYAKKDDDASRQKRQEYLTRIVEMIPENVVPRLNLIELLIRNGESSKALEHLETVQQQFPVFPEEATSFYDDALTALKNGNNDKALTSVRIFHNFVKVSSAYQAGILELKGPGGELIGFPVITVGNAVPAYVQEGESIIETIRFTDVTETVGLNRIETSEKTDQEKIYTSISLSDFDGDDDQDLYAGSYSGERSGKSSHVFQNEMGSYTEIAADAGIDHNGKEIFSSWTDFDNDGYLDLFVLLEDRVILYQNNGSGSFEEVTEQAGLGDEVSGNVARFVDLDHDGDLDLFVGTDRKNLVFRNNADGTFTEAAGEMNLADGEFETIDVAIGDFDDDGDIDLIVINKDAPDQLYSNLRQGKFQDITDKSGLSGQEKSAGVAVGDYDNDGYLDLYIFSSGNSGHQLYLNKRDGSFETDGQTENIRKFSESIEVTDAQFLDFDNDGTLDIILAGKASGKQGRSMILIHNDGWAQFEDVSRLLPENLPEIQQVLGGDFNEDGDIDLYLTTADGGIRLLRNDGGNANHFLKIQLVGLRAGSSKNNHFGIGSKVEVRSGDLYQMKVVTDPNVHFGLGTRSQADVVRIVWTNGVPQNIFTPRSDQDLIEEQELKGSCPFLYVWDGEKYSFEKDMMWRSALGMPLGIMGGETAYAFPDASEEYLKIPGQHMAQKDGKYEIQITAELWETIYFDKLRLLAIDHPVDQDIYLNEKFMVPPYPDLEIYSVKEKILPLSIRNEKNIDLYEFVSEKDDRYIPHLKHEKYQGITEMSELIIELKDSLSDKDLYLFLQGWIFPTDASINVALSQSSDLMVIKPALQVLNENCEWETVIENIGFPSGKDKTVVVDLEDKFITDQRMIRIITNMEIYWDHLFFGYKTQNPTMKKTEMIADHADLHFRGFSRMYRKGGMYGPHWFDYQDVVYKGQKWRDLTGNYTRYGEVTPLLADSDNQYVIMNAGDEMSVTFSAGKLPPLKKDWQRDFVIYSVGWVKDGDLNTAAGNTVEPLPYHGMSEYPYESDIDYPPSPELQKYKLEYNTRKVTAEEFKHAISSKKE